MVDASFMQTLWTMTPVMSGCELAEGLLPVCLYATLKSLLSTNLWTLTQQRRYCLPGFLTGGYVLRLFHGHMDECLAIPGADQGDDQRRWPIYHLIYIYTLLPVDFMSISTIFWSTLYVFWNVSYSEPHTYVLFLIFQSCSLRRRGCMQPCTILMETGAVTYRVSVFIPQHVLLSFIFSDFTAIWCSFVCACWQLERRSH